MPGDQFERKRSKAVADLLGPEWNPENMTMDTFKTSVWRNMDDKQKKDSIKRLRGINMSVLTRGERGKLHRNESSIMRERTNATTPKRLARSKFGAGANATMLAREQVKEIEQGKKKGRSVLNMSKVAGRENIGQDPMTYFGTSGRRISASGAFLANIAQRLSVENFFLLTAPLVKGATKNDTKELVKRNIATIECNQGRWRSTQISKHCYQNETVQRLLMKRNKDYRRQAGKYCEEWMKRMLGSA
ncbi:hypothetical protein T439DRAFT_331317 [Meredithblackwellia eburnea MCA 4105]